MSVGALATAQEYSWADVATRVLALYRETNVARHMALDTLPAIAAGD